MKIFRNPADVHQPLAAYTHQIEISGPERMLILSGQVGKSLDGQVPESPVEQLSLALDNLIANLKAANMKTTDLVKLTLYLVDPIDAVQRAELINTKLQGHQPCMTLLYVAALAAPIYKVELDAWASKQAT